METTPKFQNYIVRLAEKHSSNMATSRGCLQLELEGCYPLIIESIEPNILGVYYHVESIWGDVEQGSSMTFFTGHGQWVPMLFCPLDAKYRQSCRVTNRECSDVIMIDPQTHTDLVAFCEKWADELQAQGWLENAREWIPD